MRVCGDVVFRASVEIGEIAAASAGDEDFLAGAVCVLKDEDASATTTGVDGAHEAGGARAEDEDVGFSHVLCRG